MLGHTLRRQLPAGDITMTLDEQRWQKKLARKRKGQNGKRPLPTRSQLHSPASVAHRPIHDSLVAKNLFETGIGMAALARALPNGDVALAAFLVDVYCLGVKDAFYRVVSPDQFAEFVQRFDFDHIHPSCLRKLVEGVVAYARDHGFPPHPDYTGAAALFGTTEATACPVRYTYGKEGKPLYVSGPDDTPAQSQRIMEALTRRLDPKGFHFVTAVDTPEVISAQEASEPVTLYSYEITEEPMPDAAFDRLPAEVQERINGLYEKVLKPRPRQALADVKALIEQYPEIAQLHNYLYAAYFNMGEHAEAASVMQDTVHRFPDYLFGRIAWAEECLKRGEAAKIAEIFAGKFDLKLLYPDRVRFHISEVLGFHSIVARYFHAQGDRDQAQRSYDLMCQVAPKHPSTQLVRRILHPSRLASWLRDKLRRNPSA